MILSYDAYTETVCEKEEKDERITTLESEIRLMKQGQQELLELLKDPEKLIGMLQKKELFSNFIDSQGLYKKSVIEALESLHI